MTKHSQKYPTIRISARTHQIVKDLAREDQVSMADVIAEAVKKYEQQRFNERANEIWRRMMEDPEERAFWEKEDREIELTFRTPIEEPWEEESSINRDEEASS